jgi:hypothetical protein
MDRGGGVADRREMTDAFALRVAPVLRERGFTGSVPHFRRISPTRTDLLTVQFDRYGGGFVIEIAVAPPGEYSAPPRGSIPAAKLTAQDLHPRERARVRPGPDGTPASWFRYDGGPSVTEVAEQVRALIDQMEAWWAGDKQQANVHSMGE